MPRLDKDDKDTLKQCVGKVIQTGTRNKGEYIAAMGQYWRARKKLRQELVELLAANQTEDEPKMIGYDIIANMSDKDRAQEIWDRAMHPKAEEFMIKLAAFNAGRRPDPGDYTGPVIDFEKAADELEMEKPERPSAE